MSIREVIFGYFLMKLIINLPFFPASLRFLEPSCYPLNVMTYFFLSAPSSSKLASLLDQFSISHVRTYVEFYYFFSLLWIPWGNFTKKIWFRTSRLTHWIIDKERQKTTLWSLTSKLPKEKLATNITIKIRDTKWHQLTQVCSQSF